MKNFSIRVRLILSHSFLMFMVFIIAVLCHNTLRGMLNVEDVERYAFYADVAMAVIVILTLIVGITVEMKMVHYIRKHLEQLKKASQKLAEGDVNVVLKNDSQDEFGELIAEFQRMTDNIKKQAKVAQDMANGDLSVSISPNGEKDILGHALEDLLYNNNKSISELKEAAIKVTAGSDQVASASQALAQGSTEQASALEQITASINDIAEHTKESAEEANKANNLVQTAKKGALHGNTQMKEMMSAMKEINESSENISKIIKVIDDISFQTNILALNAAVEAARAGSYGKGFAVVAEEVRSLAAKSSSAASETAEMIEDSIRKVENGSKLAEETAEALNAIVDSVDSIVSLISDIALASNEQATAVAQIDQALMQVSQVVQTNSATSEECAAASEQLSSQAAKLREQVTHFKLSAAQNHSGMDYYGSDNAESSYGGIYENENEKIISLGSGFGKY